MEHWGGREGGMDIRNPEAIVDGRKFNARMKSGWQLGQVTSPTGRSRRVYVFVVLVQLPSVAGGTRI